MERQAVLASTGIPRMAQEVAVGHRVVARVAPKTAPADQDAPEFSAVRIADHEHIESVDEIAAPGGRRAGSGSAEVTAISCALRCRRSEFPRDLGARCRIR
jgi:hypothetical protein